MHEYVSLSGPDAPWRRNQSIVAKAGPHVESAAGAAATPPLEATSVSKAPGLHMANGGLPVEPAGSGGSATMEPPAASASVRAEAMAPPPPPPATEMSGSGSSLPGLAGPKLPPMPTVPGGRIKAAPPPPPETVLLSSWVARDGYIGDLFDIA